MLVPFERRIWRGSIRRWLGATTLRFHRCTPKIWRTWYDHCCRSHLIWDRLVIRSWLFQHVQNGWTKRSWWRQMRVRWIFCKQSAFRRICITWRNVCLNQTTRPWNSRKSISTSSFRLWLSPPRWSRRTRRRSSRRTILRSTVWTVCQRSINDPILRNEVDFLQWGEVTQFTTVRLRRHPLDQNESTTTITIHRSTFGKPTKLTISVMLVLRCHLKIARLRGSTTRNSFWMKNVR